MKRLLMAAVAIVVAAVAIGAPAYAAINKNPQDDGKPRDAAAACLNNNVRNPYMQHVVTSTSDYTYYTATSWTNVTCGFANVTVPKGKQALITVTANGELDCYGVAGSWCQGRVLINGSSAYPTTPDSSGSFAWATSSESAGHWQASTLIREKLFNCPATITTPYCTVPVQLQTLNTNPDMTLWLDDLAMSVTSVNT